MRSSHSFSVRLTKTEDLELSLWCPRIPELVEYRRSLKKDSAADRPHPLQVILTRTGEVNFRHPIFHAPDAEWVVFTTEEGARRCEDGLANEGMEGQRSRLVQCPRQDVPTNVDLLEVFRLLRSSYAVKVPTSPFIGPLETLKPNGC